MTATENPNAEDDPRDPLSEELADLVASGQGRFNNTPLVKDGRIGFRQEVAVRVATNELHYTAAQWWFEGWHEFYRVLITNSGNDERGFTPPNPHWSDPYLTLALDAQYIVAAIEQTPYAECLADLEAFRDLRVAGLAAYANSESDDWDVDVRAVHTMQLQSRWNFPLTGKSKAPGECKLTLVVFERTPYVSDDLQQNQGFAYFRAKETGRELPPDGVPPHLTEERYKQWLANTTEYPS